MQNIKENMRENLKNMTIEEKKELLIELSRETGSDFEKMSYANFGQIKDRSDDEIFQFSDWQKYFMEKDLYSLETKRAGLAKPNITIQRKSGEEFNVINFASFDYLGYSNNKDVIKSAKVALDKYGIGAGATPIVSGTLDLHTQLEEKLIKFYGLDGYGISLFSSGFGTLIGSISAYMKEPDHIVLDGLAHASIVDGSLLSGAKLHFFDHNDMEELEEILEELNDGKNRILICTEGVYSADGDYGDLKNIVRLAKKYGAKTLVDEAHSILVAGPTGRGVCEKMGVLGEVDLIVGTLSKAFGGVGGYLFAKKHITNYVNFYARNRMFSTSMDPAVAGGLIGVIDQAMKPESNDLRERLYENADYFRSLIDKYIHTGESVTWMVPVIYGDEKKTFEIADFLQREGFEGSMMTYPGCAKNRARIRVFINAFHTKPELERGAEIIFKGAEKFHFFKDDLSF